VFWCCPPARLPLNVIDHEDRNPESPTQLASENGLASAGVTNDRNFAHGYSRSECAGGRPYIGNGA
jgi:hypothetical protein